MSARQTAAVIVGTWLSTRKFPDRMLDSVTSDRAFVMEVLYGVIRRRRTLQWIVNRFSKGKANSKVLPYLLTGLYQVLYMTDMEDYAAVNETVNAASTKLPSAACGFVNAILRKAVREKDELLAGISNQPVGIRESHPEVLVKRWTERMGDKRTDALCEWNNMRPDITLRIHNLKTSMENYLGILKAAGVDAERHRFASELCLTIQHGVKINDLPGYEDGLFTVQDPSTIVPVQLLDVVPGQTVLDACAAPGGKTMMIAEKLYEDPSAETSELVAMDVHEDRLAPLRENVERIGFWNTTVVQGDATDPGAVLGKKKFDRVLIDAPCTNTGVLRRRPDARWRFSDDRLARLCLLQRSILEAVPARLKPSGRLVYATCSLEPEEGPIMIECWLNAHPEFRLISEVSLVPPDRGTDGIYAAAIERA